MALLSFAVATLLFSAGWWTAAIGRSLVCQPSDEHSEAILIENFDPDYLLFERARSLRQRGRAGRVLVPVPVDHETGQLDAVAVGLTDVMTRLSGIGSIERIPVPEVEPISLNAARAIQAYLQARRVHSVIVVTPLFRSRRSALVYAATLGAAGITVRCQPVDRGHRENNWTVTWHGMQEVAEQWLKLQYYRMLVLPRYLATSTPLQTALALHASVVPTATPPLEPY